MPDQHPLERRRGARRRAPVLRGHRPPRVHRVRADPGHQRPRVACGPPGREAQRARPRLGALQPDPAQPDARLEVDRERSPGRAGVRGTVARARDPDDDPGHPRQRDRRRVRTAGSRRRTSERAGCSAPFAGCSTGYDPDEVDEFFDHARAVYEAGPGPGLAGQGRPTASRSTWCAAGTSPRAVDAALDRLEAAFVARARAEYIATRTASRRWMDAPERAGPHPVRAAGPARRRQVRAAGRRQQGYEPGRRRRPVPAPRSPTSTSGTPLTAGDVRSGDVPPPQGAQRLRRGARSTRSCPRRRGAPRRRVTRFPRSRAPVRISPEITGEIRTGALLRGNRVRGLVPAPLIRGAATSFWVAVRNGRIVSRLCVRQSMRAWTPTSSVASCWATSRGQVGSSRFAASSASSSTLTSRVGMPAWTRPATRDTRSHVSLGVGAVAVRRTVRLEQVLLFVVPDQAGGHARPGGELTDLHVCLRAGLDIDTSVKL